ncbi:hypothetical protein CF335_g8766, partial [Tilletia laevis]
MLRRPATHLLTTRSLLLSTHPLLIPPPPLRPRSYSTTNSNPQPGYIGTSSLANELNLRCTVLTPAGISSVSGAFRKIDLCLQHGLEPRDLRKVDSRIPNLVPTILARKQAFLVNILHIRALIKRDTVFLFDSYGSSDTTLHSAFVYNLEHNLRAPVSSNKLPFEFRALETALSSALDALRSELYLTSDMVHYLLESLESQINQENLGRLLQYSRKVNAFLRRAQGVKTAASEVLDNDEDMALMYLTDAQAGNPRVPNNSSVEELELLLESFEKQVEEVVSEAESMASNIQNTQEVVELILDSNRNDLLNLDLRTSLTTLAVSSGTLVSGLFGMNLVNYLESNPHGFLGVSAFVGLLTASVMAMGWRMLARLRRVGLGQGHQPGGGGGIWSGWTQAGFGSAGAGSSAGPGGGFHPVGAAGGAMSMPPAVADAWQIYGKPSSPSSSTRPPSTTTSTTSTTSSSSSKTTTISEMLYRLTGGAWREKRRRGREEVARAREGRIAEAQVQVKMQAQARAHQAEVCARDQAVEAAQAGAGAELSSSPPSQASTENPPPQQAHIPYEQAAAAWLAERHAEEARWRQERTLYDVREREREVRDRELGAFGLAGAVEAAGAGVEIG